MKNYDVVIIGAGAAGLMAAAAAAACKRNTCILDMGKKPARKVAISGGGRCNFTNMAASRDRYFGENPDFVRSALARFSPTDMLTWAAEHGLRFSEKSVGQFFCDDGATAVVDALKHDAHNADLIMNCTVIDIEKSNDTFIIKSNASDIAANSVIIASGGMSFETVGVSNIGYKIARKFGHKIIPPRPALCAINTNAFPNTLAGISMPVEIVVGERKIFGDMLFTHFGIGGPAVYSASIAPATCDIIINLMPGMDLYEFLRNKKRSQGRRSISSVLADIMPARVAKLMSGTHINCNIADIKDDILHEIATYITRFIIPAGTWRQHGMRAAEVTFGGISTHDISSKTMESKLCRGLFFAGEVLDVTGDLGGFNLQWAWSSGRIAGQNA